MRRRDFIAGLGSTAAWPVVVGAQQTAMRSEVLREGHRDGTSDFDKELRQRT
jgi:hypothetical protein